MKSVRAWAESCLVGSLVSINGAHAAVHVYTGDTFTMIADARVFKAGYEAMFRSRDHVEGTVVTPTRQGADSGCKALHPSHTCWDGNPGRR